MRVLYEDNEVLVIHKPPGIASESGRAWEPDIVSEAKALLSGRKGRAEKTPPYIGLIHRLDQPVEGILVLALNRRAASFLSRELREGRMRKEYLAQVSLSAAPAGTPADPSPIPPEEAGHASDPAQGAASPAEIRLTDWMVREPGSNLSRIASPGEPGAKKAGLLYTVVRQGTGSALLRIRLLTGRHHQIRVQLSHAGLPILGDRKYGDPRWPSLCLAAAALSFRHPASGQVMEFTLSEASLLTKFPSPDTIFT